MKIQWYWFGTAILGLIFCIIIIRVLFQALRKFMGQRKLRRWSRLSEESPNILFVHCPPPAKTIPSPSPFVMKLLTFLRMAGIPYELDHGDPFGGKGKTPWISFRGENVADSELIIQFLTEKYEHILKGSYNEDELALGTAVRIMLEEHLVWGMILERFVLGSFENATQVFNMPRIVRLIAKNIMGKRCKSQGIGMHSSVEIVDLMSKDLQTVSRILGNKRFILGDSPSVEDAGIFGQLSQFYWGLPNNPYENLLNGELSNLREYCFRMRTIFWPDWK